MPSIRVSREIKKPRVVIDREAYDDMITIANATNKEVAWFCLVDWDAEGNAYVYDVHLPRQQAQTTTVEIEPEHLSQMLDEFLLKYDQEEALSMFNRMHCWGHSHVKMGTTPSGQDQSTIDRLCTTINQRFIAIRVNQRGNIECDIALPEGITFEGETPAVGFVDREREEMWTALVKERVTDIPAPVYTKGKALAVSPRSAAASSPVVGTGGTYQHSTSQVKQTPSATPVNFADSDEWEEMYQEEIRELADRALLDANFIHTAEFKERVGIIGAMNDVSDGVVRLEILECIDEARKKGAKKVPAYDPFGEEGMGYA